MEGRSWDLPEKLKFCKPILTPNFMPYEIQWNEWQSSYFALFPHLFLTCFLLPHLHLLHLSFHHPPEPPYNSVSPTPIYNIPINYLALGGSANLRAKVNRFFPQVSVAHLRPSWNIKQDSTEGLDMTEGILQQLDCQDDKLLHSFSNLSSPVVSFIWPGLISLSSSLSFISRSKTWERTKFPCVPFLNLSLPRRKQVLKLVYIPSPPNFYALNMCKHMYLYIDIHKHIYIVLLFKKLRKYTHIYILYTYPAFLLSIVFSRFYVLILLALVNSFLFVFHYMTMS